MRKIADPESVHADIVSGQKRGDFLVSVIGASFDPTRLMTEYETLVERFALRHSPRADGSTLRSISLTHRPGASEPLYDGNNTQFNPDTNEKFFLESDFTEFNTTFIDTGFYSVYNQLPFRVGRMRVNYLPPLTVFTMHVDSAPRAHIVLSTNPNCVLMSGDYQTHHVPADGNLYIFDTTQPHTAINASREGRVHITIALADEEK